MPRVDLLIDIGRSINPGVDRGQVIGGFIQGMGWVTAECLVYGEQGRAPDPLADDLQNSRDHRRAADLQLRDVPQRRQRRKRRPQQSRRRTAADARHLRLDRRQARAVLCRRRPRPPHLQLPATGEEILRCLTLAKPARKAAATSGNGIAGLAGMRCKTPACGPRLQPQFLCGKLPVEYCCRRFLPSAFRLLLSPWPPRTDSSKNSPSSRAAARPFVSVTLVEAVGSTPQDTGTKMLVDDSGLVFGTVGGGKVENQAIQFAQQMLADGDAPTCQLVEWNLQRDVGMTCGGVVKLYFEAYNFRDWRIVIFGAGHVAQALVRCLLEMECQVVCVDQRAEWLAKLPQAAKLHTVQLR